MPNRNPPKAKVTRSNRVGCAITASQHQLPRLGFDRMPTPAGGSGLQETDNPWRSARNPDPEPRTSRASRGFSDMSTRMCLPEMGSKTVIGRRLSAQIRQCRIHITETTRFPLRSGEPSHHVRCSTRTKAERFSKQVFIRASSASCQSRESFVGNEAWLGDVA